MTPDEKRKQREEDYVLQAFLDACPIPNADDARRWMKDHPTQAAAILDAACRVWHVASLLDPNATEPTAEELDAAWDRHRARAAALDGRRARRRRKPTVGR